MSDPADLVERCAAVVARTFGIDAVGATSLGSHEDLNVRVTDAEGREWVAKLAAPGVNPRALASRLAAVDGLGAVEGLRVPHVARTPQGEAVVVADVGVERLLCVLEYLPGRIATADPRPPAGFATRLGETVATMTRALSGVAAEVVPGGGPWDLREAPRVVAEAAGALEDAERTVVAAAFGAAWERVQRLAASLPVQVIHGDLSADNCVLDADGHIAGVIDFGDVGEGWRVAELAVAMASLLHHDGDAVALAIEAARACDAVAPMTDAELGALWPLVVARAAVLVSSAAVVAAADEHNAYSSARRPLERRILERALSVSFDEAELLLRHSTSRLPATTEPAWRSMCDSEAATVVVALGVEQAIYDAGAFAEPGAIRAAIIAAAGDGVAVTEYGACRLLPAALIAGVPRSVPLGVEAAMPAGGAVIAPAAATVVATGEGWITLSVAGAGVVDIHGVEPSVVTSARVAAGDVIARVVGETGHGIVWVQRRTCADLPAPRFVAPGRETAWERLCPDPSALFGVAPRVRGTGPREAMAIRRAHVASVQEHYYEEPPRIERGWRHHLIDTAGRGYLDMVNNVAVVGHGEPRIADAVSAQLRLLNTNSRFHYGAIADFSAELAARAPTGLDAVFLVNSGSEAVDLALRIVRAATGRDDVLALAEAYHGWTVGADAVSTSLGDNPRALGTRPGWVHLLDSPNAYRGTHRGAESHRYLDDALVALEELDARSVSLAGVIAEPIFGNGGGILLPPGYLAGLWAAVRARGGLAISDEVQVSYGRLGRHFWGFEQQGVVPDVIAVAKAMGNGHPLGAVITTREIAEAFAVEGSFFSSAGGSPVSCVVGSEVLRILDEDGLQRNAAEVGELLREGLEALATRHPLLGEVHGMGLYLGVEVGGPDTPDAAAARAICDALRDEGVIVQPTGDHKNVLKIKPPLTIDAAAVERFLAALDRVLTWREARAAV